MLTSKIGALIGSGKPALVGDLYSYVIAQISYSTPKQRQHLIRRMREAMIKVIILCGIPIVLKALSSVAELEQEEDKDYHFSRYESLVILCRVTILCSHHQHNW